MTGDETNLASYGLWVLVFVNAAIFIIFAFSFAKPQSARDWRSFGAFSAFIIRVPADDLYFVRLAANEFPGSELVRA